MRSKKSKHTNLQNSAAVSSECPNCHEYMQQAEICCEQARAAAQLKRLKAACGLFATAQALLTRAVSLGGDACSEARERLNSISAEMATYCELAKSAARPIHQSKTSLMNPAPVRSSLGALDSHTSSQYPARNQQLRTAPRRDTR
jgi:hypothetical protein